MRLKEIITNEGKTIEVDEFRPLYGLNIDHIQMPNIENYFAIKKDLLFVFDDSTGKYKYRGRI